MKAMTAASFAFAALLGSAAVAAEKPTVVLVHGAFEDAGVWRGVEAGLKKDGYRTVSVDLPGRPSNPQAPDQINLATYRDAVLDKLSDESRPVVLVGHSFGGIVISDVAEHAPTKVRTLVYVAGLVPRDGDSLASMAQSDGGSSAGRYIRFLPEKGIATVPVEARGDLFANDGNPGQKRAVSEAIVDEPLAPLAEAVHVGAQFAAVDKAYIRTTQDRVVSPAAQSAMIAGASIRKRFTVKSGHTPFVTAGPALVAAIEASAN